MPEITGLQPGDPAGVADYWLTGRLGPNVFTGTSRADEAVVVRLLPEELDAEPFLRAMEPMRRLSAVGTAQVLDVGVQDGRVYLVTEFVDGEPLSATFDKVGLYRLAAGTITALVAIHQAGLVHGDIRPGNVLLGPDGPRVIDAGLEQALAESAIATRKVAVPAYTAPERLRGQEATPASDVFAWAATMVFAVRGASPFEGGSMSATVERIRNAEPELPDLGELQPLITACLSRDPAARPAASDVLLRLVGQTSLLTGREVVPVQEAGPPVRRGRPAVVLAAAFAAGAVLSGAGVYALTGTREPITIAAATVSPTPSGTTTITSSPTEAPTEKVAKAKTETKLPKVGVTLHEHPDDAVRLSTYTDGGRTTYARDKSGAFKAVGQAERAVVGPDGDWVALRPGDAEPNQVTFTRLSTGESFVVGTVGPPLRTLDPVWSRDGRRLLLSVHQDTSPLSSGFVIIDVTARKAAHVATEPADAAALPFTFAPDGTVVRGYQDGERSGVEFFDTAGRVTKRLHWVGLPRNTTWYSPSGARFATVCPNGGEYCVWDTRTGARQATVPFGHPESRFLGWFTDKHLLVQDPAKKKGFDQVKVTDLLGEIKRVVADIPVEQRELFLFDLVRR